jgi:hypothetical protein
MKFSYVTSAQFYFGRVRFFLVYSEMQLNINSCKSVRNFEKLVVCICHFAC